VEDLEAWEKFAGVRIGAGDALLVHGALTTFYKPAGLT
jgi:hypothetical protein